MNVVLSVDNVEVKTTSRSTVCNLTNIWRRKSGYNFFYIFNFYFAFLWMTN